MATLPVRGATFDDEPSCEYETEAIYSKPLLCILSKNQKYSGARGSKNKNTPKYDGTDKNFGVLAPKIKNTPERKAQKTKILRNMMGQIRILEYQHQKSKILRSESLKKQKYSKI